MTQLVHPIDTLPYRRIIKDVATEFELAVYWWYNEVYSFTDTFYMPDVTFFIEEHPYLQNIYDLVIISEAIKMELISNFDEMNDELYQLIAERLISLNFDKLILDLLHDIKLLLNSRMYVYIQSDFFEIELNTPLQRENPENSFDVYNSPLHSVW